MEELLMRIPFSAAACAAILGVAALSATSAQAGEINAGTPVPGATGSITNGSTTGLTAVASPVLAMFMGFSAADNDTLNLTNLSPLSTPPMNPIFDNQTNHAGDTASLVVTPGQNLDFYLTDNTVTNTFHIGTAYANTDGSPIDQTVYHFAEFTFTTGSNDAADEALYNATFTGLPMTAGEFSTIEANGGFAAWTFLGVEDRTTVGNDDWNDLIYGFHNVAAAPPPVPEPMTLSLFAAGLAGAAWMRRRKNKSA
jgi:hypothetical protein